MFTRWIFPGFIKEFTETCAGWFFKATDSAHNWDGIVGVKGQWDFTDKWYATGYFDVGTGDSDYTWQVLASVAYRFKRLDAVVGYRYLQYEFDKDAPIKDLDVRGPFFGAKFLF